MYATGKAPCLSLTTPHTSEEWRHRGKWVWATCPESIHSLAPTRIEPTTRPLDCKSVGVSLHIQWDLNIGCTRPRSFCTTARATSCHFGLSIVTTRSSGWWRKIGCCKSSMLATSRWSLAVTGRHRPMSSMCRNSTMSFSRDLWHARRNSRYMLSVSVLEITPVDSGLDGVHLSGKPGSAGNLTAVG